MFKQRYVLALQLNAHVRDRFINVSEEGWEDPRQPEGDNKDTFLTLLQSRWSYSILSLLENSHS